MRSLVTVICGEVRGHQRKKERRRGLTSARGNWRRFRQGRNEQACKKSEEESWRAGETCHHRSQRRRDSSRRQRWGLLWSSVVKMWISLPWTWVQSLVGELRSHKPCSMEEKKEKEKNSTSGIINIGQWGNANGKWEHKDTECGVFFFPRNFGVKRSERWQLEGSQGNWGEEVFCFKARWCLSSL